MKILYFDLETSGLDPVHNAIIEIGGLIEINGEEKEEFSIRMSPDADQAVDPEALNAIGLSRHEVYSYQPQEDGYKKFISIIEKYINPFNKRDKFFIVGYNCHAFDVPFLRNFFLRYYNKYFGSYFYHPSIDVLLLIGYFSMGQRDNLANYKLGTVAKSLGIPIEEEKFHSALYDVKVTREIFNMIRTEYVVN